jgi:type VI secretion system protein
MREYRLLDRIRVMARNPSRRMTQDPKQMIRSIQEHLQRILNTRQGNVIIAPDYGIPDFTNFMGAFPEAQRELERTIRHTIQTYEPRLQGVRVNFLPREDDPLTLSFQIQARLALKDHREAVTFESVLDAGGQIKVKG